MFPSNAVIESSSKSWRYVIVAIALTRQDNPLWENVVILQVGEYQQLKEKDSYKEQKLCNRNADHEVPKDLRKP